jgi:hypothetical protein
VPLDKLEDDQAGSGQRKASHGGLAFPWASRCRCACAHIPAGSNAGASHGAPWRLCNSSCATANTHTHRPDRTPTPAGNPSATPTNGDDLGRGLHRWQFLQLGKACPHRRGCLRRDARGTP